MAQSLLLIAHGSRRAEANADLEHLAEILRQTQQYIHVQPSYLELAEPNIIEGGKLCAQFSPREIIMVPYFLSPGMHVREDLTAAQKELQQLFPTIPILLAEPLGRHPLLVEVVKQRVAEIQQIENTTI
jgi:sirohydrochlorin ferrochelatase